MHRAIIFDFDGVIRHWDQDEARAIESRFGLPEGAIAAAAFDPALLERAVTGRILDETWRLAIRNALVRAHGPDAAGAEEQWSARQGRIDREVVAIVAEMRKRMRTGLLTNATTRLETDLQAFKLDQAFDVVVNSSRIGYAKPSPAIYRAAWHRLGFPPEQCIFIDDTPGHVEAACESGLTGILFQGVGPLRDALRRLVGDGTETG
jgi:putative hydrolase of the HAD superfamily